MRNRFPALFAVCCLLAAFSVPVSALEYTVEAPDAGLFGFPTSDDTVYVTTNVPVNVDRSKSAAYIPPAFGSLTSYTLNSWELLTPNLGSENCIVTGNSYSGVTMIPPNVNDTQSVQDIYTGNRYTAITPDLYYSAGHIGTLMIPSIDLTVKVYQGTDSATLKKGAGHFESTSFFTGNTVLAAHNRGVTNHFGKIHTLSSGDTVKLITKLGTKTYKVYSVAKIAVDDLSVLNDTREDMITLITCVKNQPEYRWCVRAATAD